MAQTHISPLNQNYVTEFDLLVQPKVIQTEIVTMETICIYCFSPQPMKIFSLSLLLHPKLDLRTTRFKDQNPAPFIFY